MTLPKTKGDRDTVLLLAGDIHLGLEARPFVEDACKRFRKVIKILGNHEFYGWEYNDLRRQWKHTAASMKGNFEFLDDAVCVVDDVRILGTTLWTDYDGNNWFAKQQAKKAMKDFYVIRKENQYYEQVNWHPDDVVKAHMLARFFLTEELRKPWHGKTVVMTHHLPHPLCVHERFRADPLNPAWMTNMDDVIAANDIAVWCHGHTHDNVDVEVHDTRILCNPRGYDKYRALNPDFDPEFAFEI
jgi:predicted phosphodiesterase